MGKIGNCAFRARENAGMREKGKRYKAKEGKGASRAGRDFRFDSAPREWDFGFGSTPKEWDFRFASAIYYLRLC